jgi:hypothetical protein
MLEAAHGERLVVAPNTPYSGRRMWPLTGSISGPLAAAQAVSSGNCQSRPDLQTAERGRGEVTLPTGNPEERGEAHP